MFAISMLLLPWPPPPSPPPSNSISTTIHSRFDTDIETVIGIMAFSTSERICWTAHNFCVLILGIGLNLEITFVRTIYRCIPNACSHKKKQTTNKGTTERGKISVTYCERANEKKTTKKYLYVCIRRLVKSHCVTICTMTNGNSPIFFVYNCFVFGKEGRKGNFGINAKW